MLLRILVLSVVVWEGGGLTMNILETFRRVQMMRSRTLRSRPERPLPEYDFVVVGAGPAGSVLTHRLTEDPATSVLLIEDGPADNFVSEAPAMNIYMIMTDYNWNFHTERQDGICQGLEEERCPWPSGRGAGGGTAMNAMIYTRGNSKDFDYWVEQGAEGWSFNEVLPYFKKSEKMTIPEMMSSEYHGTKGNVAVGYSPFKTPLLDAFLNTGRSMGFNLTDYNSPGKNLGISRIQFTMADGLRMGASKAYLKPIVNRKNFHLALNTRATRVLIDPATKRAYGVEYMKDGKWSTVRVKKEVVLSAGAFNTPQLLMVSGIGPADHLKSLGIPVVQDLPVGDGLEEHVGMNGLVFLVDSPITLLSNRISRKLMEYTMDLVMKGEGVMSSPGCEGIAFKKTRLSRETGDKPDIELLFVPTAVSNDGGQSVAKTMEVSEALYNAVYANISFKDAFTIWPILLYPKSKGYVRLRNRNPLSKVRIYPNFLQHPDDVATLVEGLKLAVEMGESKIFKKYGARLHRVPFPDCAHLKFGSDEYWECAARQMTSQFHHQCCTAKIGPVLDPRLRVRGVAGLRVADASVMPSITGGHTQAPCYMIGEKAADLIKQDWRL